jgi:hypothetical protein
MQTPNVITKHIDRPKKNSIFHIVKLLCHPGYQVYKRSHETQKPLMTCIQQIFIHQHQSQVVEEYLFGKLAHYVLTKGEGNIMTYPWGC